MKRSPLTHERVFSDEEYAERYAGGHWRMAEKFGEECAGKLKARGFGGGKIIDVGCGFGATNIVLAEQFPDSELVGIDLSEPLLELARGEAEKRGFSERVRFEVGDVGDIPFEDDSFDAAINVNMLHLVEDPVKMLDEIERVLKPGGFLFIADLQRSLLGLLEEEIKFALTLGEARELFAQSRLREGKFSWGMLWWRFEVR
jgi:ubiquinone/menaquinone biosynthesis C-methylase UbiE